MKLHGYVVSERDIWRREEGFGLPAYVESK